MLSSMTAFAKVSCQKDSGRLTWEIRSVNNRYLELDFNLPEFLRSLEPLLRDVAKKFVSRGSLNCRFSYQAGEKAVDDLVINKPLLKQLIAATQSLNRELQEKSVLRASELLRWPGMLQMVERNRAPLMKEIKKLFEEAMKQLVVSREREGQKLRAILLKRLKDVEGEVGKAASALPQILSTQRQKLMTRFQDAQVTLDPARLEQEMVFFAQKLDVQEELDRLKTHVAEVRRILSEETNCGRRLDFLMQELNREANTLGSKSASTVTTGASVQLKVLIEQMREQIQNIE
jgi:uncharacterized protein (TIGR00255 family)